ncbi:MAG: hypothetical protein ACREJ4_09410, partial [Candidatus Methylomirabilaceae bacterium]
QALRRFLRQAGVAESFLSTWTQEESKRDFLDRLFAKLPEQNRGQELLMQMAKDLAAQDTYPDPEASPHFCSSACNEAS